MESTIRERAWRFPAGLKLYLGGVWAISAITALVLAWYHLRGIDPLEAQLWSTPADRFGDLWHYRPLFQHLHTRAFFQSEDRFAYPAPLAVVYELLYRCGDHTSLVFNAVLAMFALASGVLFCRMLLRYGVHAWLSAGLTVTLLATSYPWHMLYDRANMELFVYGALALGVWAYLSKRAYLAAVLWGVAGALKLYPLVVLLVLLRRGTLRAFFTGACAAGLIFLASCWYVGPTVADAALGTVHGTSGFLMHYAANARRSELNQDHSVLGAIKEVLSLNMLHLGQQWSGLGQVYEAAALLLAPLVYLRWVRPLPALNQLCLLLLAIELLPPVSYDYTLVHSYLIMGIVTAAYLAALQRGEDLRYAPLLFAAFALLATSQTWIELRGLRINGILKCAALAAVGLALFRIRLTIDRRADEPAAGQVPR